MHNASSAAQLQNLQELTTYFLTLIVDGPSLGILLVHEELARGLLEFACLRKAVAACRLSPEQAKIMRLVQRGVKLSPITLVIGDGANDIGMIQVAQVGVDISGNERMQTVNSSDFAIT